MLLVTFQVTTSTGIAQVASLEIQNVGGDYKIADYKLRLRKEDGTALTATLRGYYRGRGAVALVEAAINKLRTVHKGELIG